MSTDTPVLLLFGVGEGLGNLFGVSLADFLLKSGNFSSLYMLLTVGALGAMVITGFTVCNLHGSSRQGRGVKSSIEQ